MSTQQNDGGSAFPHGPLGDSIQYEDGRVSHQWNASSGMSLRDWFAGQALASLAAPTMACATTKTNIEDAVTHLGKFSYKLADAMLKAREQ